MLSYISGSGDTIAASTLQTFLSATVIVLSPLLLTEPFVPSRGLSFFGKGSQWQGPGPESREAVETYWYQNSAVHTFLHQKRPMAYAVSRFLDIIAFMADGFS
jgi:hypothetical protein